MINGINGITNKSNDATKIEPKSIETAIASLWGPVLDYLDKMKI